MTTKTVFIGTDVDIYVTASGINLSSATEIECVLRKSGVADILLLKTVGGITVNSSTSATINVSKTAITVPGIYAIRLTVTESSGKERGMTLDVTHLIFE